MYALHSHTIIAAIQCITNAYIIVESVVSNMLNMQSDIGLVCGTIPVRILTQFTVAIFDAIPVFSVFYSCRTEYLKIGYSLL